MRSVSDKFVGENKTQILYSIFCFFLNRALYKIMCKNIAQPGRSQMKILRMRIVCWIPKATNSHSQYVLINDFPLQKFVHDCASILRYTYITSLGKWLAKI
jgi:hypothetical protein